MKKIMVIGAGIWGTVFANFLAKRDFETFLWSIEEDVVFDINNNHRNLKYLGEYILSDKLKATSDLLNAYDCDIIINATPVQYIKSVWDKLPGLKDKFIINLSKGIDIETLEYPVDILKKSVGCENKFFVLSGPSFAIELYKEMQTAVVLAGEDEDGMIFLQNLLSSEILRIYRNYDIIGVEIAGALKNVIAIGAGIVEGLGLGSNTQAAIITRGIAEVTRFGKIFGAKTGTFFGLAGIGDFILTCTNQMSRNYKFGLLIGKRKEQKEALNNAGGVVEGYYTLKAINRIIETKEIDMPIIQSIYEIIYGEKEIEDIVYALMTRKLKDEMWGID